MAWEYINGQWLTGGQPSATPPPQGTPFFSTDVNGARDFRTFYGPESMVGVGAPIATTLPRQSVLPGRLPYRVTTPPLATGGTPPPVAPPVVTPPVAPNPFSIRDGRISGSYFNDPASAAPKGYNPELWAQRFAGPQVGGGNFTGQMAPPIMPHQVENPFATYINNGLRMPQKTAPQNLNNYTPQLIASLDEAAKYGVYGTGEGKERAQFVLNALQNPALLGNPARDPNRVAMKGMGGGPTNPIDRAGMLYDVQAARGAANTPPLMELPPDPAAPPTTVHVPPPSAFSDPTVSNAVQNPFSSRVAEYMTQRPPTSVTTPEGRRTTPASRDPRRAFNQPKRYADGTMNPFVTEGVNQNPFLVPSYANGTTATPAVRPMPVAIENSIYKRFQSNSLTAADMSWARRYSMTSLANAIGKRMAGLPATYTAWTPEALTYQAPPTAPVTPPNTPPVVPTPTVPPVTTPPVGGPAIPTTPQMNPQVIWYDGDVWKNSPTLKYFNNEVQGNPFMNLSRLSSYDPATDTKLNSPRSLNAKTAMDIDSDPVARGMQTSIHTRHNRSWEKELQDAVKNAPMGNSSSYVRTG